MHLQHTLGVPFFRLVMKALEKAQALDIPTHFYDLFNPQSASGYFQLRYTR